MTRLLYLMTLCLISVTVNAQNKVFHTKFDNGQAQDVSGNGFHGTLFGGPTACPGVTGIANTALYFDGINDFVQLPTDPAFNLTKWTLHAIVKPQAFNSQNCQASGIIWHDLQWSDKFYSLYICDNFYDNDCGTDSDMEAFGGQATGSSSTPDFQSPWYTSNGFLTEDEWYCVVLTYDGAMMKLYVNGDFVDSGLFASNYNYTSSSSTIIGNAPEPGFYYWFKGVIDEVSIWDDAVSFAQVTGSLCDSFLIATSTNVNTAQKEKIDVYPSPAGSTVNLDVSNHWKGANWELLDITGQTKVKGTIARNIEVIDVSNLPVGVYLIKVYSTKGVQTSKFIKQ